MRAALLAVLLLTACDSSIPLSPDAVTTDGGLYLIDLVPTPDPPVSGSTALELTIAEAEGERAVTDADVSITPWMPMMDHGITGEPAIVEQGDGVYNASWSYSMPGYWELTIEVDGDAGVDEVLVGYDVE